MRSLFGELREGISGKGVKIVFPEGNDDRVVRAAARLKFEGLVDPIILGDDLYGGSLDYGIKRQALHCHRLAFIDPFTKKEMVHASSLTDDFETVIMDLKTKKD